MESEEKSWDSSVENEKSHPPGTWRHQRPVQRLAFFFHELFHDFAESRQQKELLREDCASLSNYFLCKSILISIISLQQLQFFAIKVSQILLCNIIYFVY